LVDGKIVGTWWFEEEKDRTTLILHFLRKIEEPILHSVRLEAKALSRFIYGREVELTEQ